MDGVNDFLSLYVSRSDSQLPVYNNHTQEDSLFTPSPKKLDGLNSNSHIGMNGYGGDTPNNSGVFCRKNNFDQCLDHLNQELASVGLFSLYERGSKTYDPVRLVNCTFELLQQFQRSRRVKDELENRVHQLECDLSHNEEVKRTLMQQLSQSRQETVQSEERERQATVKIKQLTAKLKSEKDEVRRLQSVLQHRDIQHKHEIKKKEREHDKLRERLHQMLTDKKGATKGMVISGVLQRADGSRGTWSGSKHEEELFRSVISNYEAKTKELMVENAGLRQCLCDIQSELLADNLSSSSDRSTISGSLDDLLQGSTDTGEIDVGKNAEDAVSSAGQCQLPLEFLEGTLLKSINDRCRLLKKYIKNLEKQKSDDVKLGERKSSPTKDDHKDTQDIEKLMKDIKRYKEIIEQQEQFIQDSIAKNTTDGSLSFMNESELEEEKENLAVQKKLFEEQKVNFWKERNAFTEATIKLHKERKIFEETKAMFLKEQFLQITPFTKRSHQASGKSAIPSQPAMNKSPEHAESLSPVCEGRETPESQRLGLAATPTTVDLYKFLGISNDKKLMENRPLSADPTIGPTPSGFFSKRNCSPSWARSGTRRCTSAISHTHTPQQRSNEITKQTSNIKMLLFQHRNRTLELSDGENAD